MLDILFSRQIIKLLIFLEKNGGRFEVIIKHVLT